jgi:hypothetical protein
MTEAEQDQTLQKTVDCYVAMLSAVGDCLGEACPPVGGPYQHRFGRLKARLAFDVQAEAVEETYAEVAAELKNYAQKASAYLDQHGTQMRRAAAGLEQIVRLMAERQDFYGARLRHFATQLESTPSDGSAAQAETLLSCVESMTHETRSLLVKMRDEMASIERRLAESEITDPVTGLMNRRELERRMEASRESPNPVTKVLLTLTGNITDEVAQEAAKRINTQFRHHDVVGRWGHADFMVLFQGSPETAEMRVSQVLPWISGRYALDAGGTTEIAVEMRLVDAETTVR